MIIAYGLGAWLAASVLTGLLIGRALRWSSRADVSPLGEGVVTDDVVAAAVRAADECGGTTEAPPRTTRRRRTRRRAGNPRADVVVGNVRRSSTLGRPSP